MFNPNWLLTSDKDVKLSKEIPILNTTVISIKITCPKYSLGLIPKEADLIHHFDTTLSSGHKVVVASVGKSIGGVGIGYYYLIAIKDILSKIPGRMKILVPNRYAISCLTEYYKQWGVIGWNGIENAELIKSCISALHDRDITLEYLNVKDIDGIENKSEDPLKYLSDCAKCG